MKTILLVDDEFALVDSLTELLEHEGYRVVSAANGKDGVERFRSEKPDLIVTDLMMPIASGRELIRDTRALPEGRDVPIILVSASPRSVALVTPEGPLDVAAFLRKPFSWEKLLTAVRQLIGAPEKE